MAASGSGNRDIVKNLLLNSCDVNRVTKVLDLPTHPYSLTHKILCSAGQLSSARQRTATKIWWRYCWNTPPTRTWTTS